MKIVLGWIGVLTIGATSLGWYVDTAYAASGTQLAESQVRPDADNTGVNARDRAGTMLTPADQGASDKDVAITQQIRQQVVSDDALSTNAKNVKIITVGGVVTLRGPVKTENEKATIAAAATHASGVKGVQNQLEIER